MDAKAEILGRIRAASVKPTVAVRGEVVASGRSRDAVVAQFVEYVAEYKASVFLASAGEVGEAVAGLLKERGSGRVVIPVDLPEGWCPGGISDSGFGHRELETMAAVVTGCALGIAETGTIVLDCGPGQGRRVLSLIPDHHVCVILEDQIVDSMPEAVAALRGAVEAGRALTWISGPSATSDIELSRVEGVHGPRTLDVVVVRRDAPPPEPI